MIRRIGRLLLFLFLAGQLAYGALPPPETSVEELQAQMTAGRLTSRELTQGYLQRIEAIDRAGPKLNAVIEVNPDALALAEQLDAERVQGKVRGPLHGIPVLIKDNIATVDRMETTAGSLALVGAKPREEAQIVQRLRAAGAVILGKTNLSEWANFRSNRSVSGWSSRGGLTRNAYALDRSASGSSSGSAVAVTAGLCAAAIGTETDGSIMSPSGQAGIVGIKPTVGLVSRAGIIPIAASQDTAGPMARSVPDAAMLLEAIAAPEASGAAGLRAPANLSTAYVAALKPGALKGARIGVWRGSSSFKPLTAPVLEAALTVLRNAGAEIVDPMVMPEMKGADDAEFTVLLYEFKDGLNAYLGRLGPDSRIKSLADVMAFNRSNWLKTMPYFEQETLEKAEAKGPLLERAYLDARATCIRLTRTEGMDAVMDRDHLDAIVAVTNGPSWVVDIVNGDRFTGGSSSPAAMAGYPNVTVPAGEARGLPIGLSFMGRAWSEAKLLSYAAEFEDRSHRRRLPTFAPAGTPR